MTDMEFPFSEGGRYAKKTLSEACVDDTAMFLEDDDGEDKPTGKFSCKLDVSCFLLVINRNSPLIVDKYISPALRRKAKKSTEAIRRPKASREDDEEEEMDEFGLMVKSSVPQPNDTANETMNEQVIGQEGRGTILKRNSVASDTESIDEILDTVWKRVKDPRGLPEQDASVLVKSRKTLKEEILHNKNLLHKYSQRLFDDRMFIVNDEDPGHSAGEELALNQAIGVNKYKSPIVAKIAEYVAPGLEGLKVGLSVWRAMFNLFTWRDPFLTSLFFFVCVVILCVLIVFPWRLFFFVVGFGAVGPQVS